MKNSVRLSALVFVLMVIFIFGGSVPAAAQQKVSAEITLEALVGQVLVITVESNPTTGYTWALAKPLNKIGIGLKGDYYLSNPHAENMVGVGGVDQWVFVPTKAGKYLVALKHYRIWEGSRSIIEIKNFRVSVRSAKR